MRALLILALMLLCGCPERGAYLERKMSLEAELLKLDQQLQHAPAFSREVQRLRELIARTESTFHPERAVPELNARGIDASSIDLEGALVVRVDSADAANALTLIGDILDLPVTAVKVAGTEAVITIAQLASPPVRPDRNATPLAPPGLFSLALAGEVADLELAVSERRKRFETSGVADALAIEGEKDLLLNRIAADESASPQGMESAVRWAAVLLTAPSVVTEVDLTLVEEAQSPDEDGCPRGPFRTVIMKVRGDDAARMSSRLNPAAVVVERSGDLVVEARGERATPADADRPLMVVDWLHNTEFSRAGAACGARQELLARAIAALPDREHADVLQREKLWCDDAASP